MPKNTKCVTYDLKKGKKIVYRGITNNPKRREKEHKNSGKKFTHMAITSRTLSEKSADKKEDKALSTYRKHHRGKNPKYNKDNTG